jgi:peptidyl-prolyl cis-trans isomerase C
LTLALAALASPGALLAAPLPDNPVVAIVNGAEIHRSDLDSAQQRLPEQYRQIPLQMIYDPLLEQVISNRLLVAAATKDKLQDKPEVQAEIARARDDVLRNSLLEQSIKNAVTDDKLKAAYESTKHQPGFAQEEVHAQHILVADEATARDVIKQLGEGKDFAELAKSKSTDPTAQENSGDLGYFKRDAMVPEFSEAAFKMDPGTVSKDPIQTQFGWHVIKVLDRRTAVPSFEEKEPELREQVSRQIVDQLVAQVHNGAQIQRFNLDGTPKTEAPAGQPGQPPKPAQ